ncbi:MAG: Peptidyl-prolyl cis-trans isomerase [Parcubacteria group bacterium GW2011_GWC1_36_9]|uniref:Peptidyl-prolyl cis-trans isomerase n=1 Tax=Candidatus Yanofskybacteria bacterium GW2011_GWC2_37_9 TaxID=1619028 RepID=A0A0G0HT77_9BACT|nr:MAG: Peptidyl-prolyl cis-trans isomerase [Parcubacteria group bacterium GW2011_GWC1_36_9]KKQ46353.1 MAG: Peptidyl-prolyl cis-trans isomerase [Candidatus Yanofskybacteria bacterium GW2011_GWC2_37_9]
MNKYTSFVIIVIAIVLGIWFFTGNRDKEKNIINSNNQDKTMNVTLHTNKGDITIEFFEKQTPNTVANFVKLAKEGFYDGVKFHRVIKGFMIQGGDPLSKDDSKINLWGTGGPGYSFADELGRGNENNRNDVGTISMANSGPNTNGSQFFINVVSNNFLDTKHVVFGKVMSGMDIVKEIENMPTLLPGIADRPASAVVIENISFN